jgi:hypothetical protein
MSVSIKDPQEVDHDPAILADLISRCPMIIKVQVPYKIDDPKIDENTIQRIRLAIHAETKRLLGSIRRQIPLATFQLTNATTPGQELVDTDFSDDSYGIAPRDVLEMTKFRVKRIVSERLALARLSALPQK